MLLYLLHVGLLGINLWFSTAKYRHTLTPEKFVVMVSLYGFIMALSSIYGMRGTGSDSAVLIAYLFPVILAGYFYKLRGSLIAAGAVYILDCIGLLGFFFSSGGSVPLLAMVYPLFTRAIFYFIMAFTVSFVRGEEKVCEESEIKIRELKDRLEDMREDMELMMPKVLRLEEAEDEIVQLKVNMAETKRTNEVLETKIKDLIKEKEEIQKHSKRTELLKDISHTLSSNLDQDLILSKFLSLLNQLVSFKSGAIFLYNSDKTGLYLANWEGKYKYEMELSLSSYIGIPQIVAGLNKPLLIESAKDDPRFDSILETARISSALYLPISLDGEVFGVIALWSQEGKKYLPVYMDFLMNVAREAAVAIKNAGMYYEMGRRLDFISSLWETSQSLTTASYDLVIPGNPTLARVLKNIKDRFGADSLIYFTYDRDNRVFVPQTGININEKEIKNYRVSLEINENKPGELKSFQKKDIKFEPDFENLSFVQGEGNEIVSMAWSYLRGKHRINGSIVLFSIKHRVWTQEEMQWLDILTNIFSMTIENVQLLYDVVSEKKKLQTLIDNVPEGVFTVDTERRIQIWSNSAEKITGFKMVDVINKDCGNFIRCQTMEGIFCHGKCPVSLAMFSGDLTDSGTENLFLIHSQGRKIPVFLTSAPLFDEQGNCMGAIVVFRDITKEKEIEKMKEEFLATITHDLKSPLASVMGYAELMLNPRFEAVGGNREECLNSLLNSSKTLQILINNILESTRMEAGKLKLNRTQFPLEKLTADLEEMFLPMVSARKLELIIDMEPGLKIWGDYEKFKQVFINLISNAIKFTPEGGKITLSAQQQENRILVKVADTGKGIPEDQQFKLFKKFSQVQGEKQGTGLGLYICKKIVEAHGEKISLSSRLGEGTEFSVGLPLPVQESDISHKKIIFIIESEQSLLDMMKKLFEDQEYEVITAHNKTSAEEIIKATEIPPRVIILDWQLEGDSPLDIMKSFRNNPLLCSVPILLLCDYREEIGGDFDGVINKPVNLRDLLLKTNAFARLMQL